MDRLQVRDIEGTANFEHFFGMRAQHLVEGSLLQVSLHIKQASELLLCMPSDLLISLRTTHNPEYMPSQSLCPISHTSVQDSWSCTF